MFFISLVVLFSATFFPLAFSPSSSKTRAAMPRRIPIFLAAVLLAAFLFYALRVVPITEARLSSRYTKQVVLQDTFDAVTKEALFEPPLRTAGRDILDANDQRFKLASVNWYGASDIYFVAMGLDVRHRSEIAATIRKMGFNSVRFPYSDQMVLENPVIDPVHLTANMDLLDDHGTSPRAIDVYKACVEAMTDAGLAVIPNNHITNAHWCDGKNLCDARWNNDHYGPICKIHQTTETWIENWKTVMELFIDNPRVIGADLRNEPRGLWGTINWNMWATAAEQASEALLDLQPNWLMFMEGIGSANDCSGARTRPVQLSIPNRVVYSSHVYKWSGWSTLVPYSKRKYVSFAADMEYNWGYLLTDNIAPVWVGEFGITGSADEGDLNYWNHLMRYLEDTDADWGYWSLNPNKPAEYGNETYGLLQPDWMTPREDFRMHDLKRLM